MTKDTHFFYDLPVTSSEINQCSYSSWSTYFPDHVPEAVVLQNVPQAFVSYLNSDSIRLPQAKNPEPVAPNSDNEYSDWEDENEHSDPCAGFADFDRQVQDAVAKYKAVMVKLNWSAAKDAKWILINNSLRCTSNTDIYLLLNASDHIAHDLDGHVYDECADHSAAMARPVEVVLKKWISDFNPALEFRMFIKNNELVAVSQRDLNHYQFLTEIHDKLHSTLGKFHAQVLRRSGFSLQNYIADVYIRAPYDDVMLIDINPFTHKWDSLLFTWNEILEHTDAEFELRLLTETNIGALGRRDHSENQVPIEVVDASMNSEAMIELARTWDASRDAPNPEV